MNYRWQLVLGASGAMAVVYSIAILGFVATTPDIGIRCLIADRASENGAIDGFVIRDVPADVSTNGAMGTETRPRIGDRLTRVGYWPIHTFVDMTKTLIRLRSEPVAGGLV